MHQLQKQIIIIHTCNIFMSNVVFKLANLMNKEELKLRSVNLSLLWCSSFKALIRRKERCQIQDGDLSLQIIHQVILLIVSY